MEERGHNLSVQNSLDLDPEWGAIDLIEDVETTFECMIEDHQAAECTTVGDVYRVLCARAPEWDEQSGNCASSIVFYRLRHSLSATARRGVTPKMPLAAFALHPSQLLKKITRDTGLRVPIHRLTLLGKIGGWLTFIGILVAIVALFTQHWMESGAAALVAVGGFPLQLLDRGQYPTGVVTFGDLVRRIAPLNVTKLRDVGGAPADRWSVLVALAAEHGVLSPREIGPDTFLHRKSLELANAR